MTAVIASLLVGASLAGSMAAEIRVPQDHTTIQGAIDAASNGDIVIIAPGTYIENIEVYRKSVTLTSISPDDPAIVEATVIIPSNSIYHCITLYEAPHCVVSGLTVRLGSGNPGIYVDSTAVIVNNRIEGPDSNGPAIDGGARPGHTLTVKGNTIIIKANPMRLAGSCEAIANTISSGGGSIEALQVIGNTISSSGGSIRASQLLANTISRTTGSIEASQLIGNTISTETATIEASEIVDNTILSSRSTAVSGGHAESAVITGNTMQNCSISAHNDSIVAGNTTTGHAQTIRITGLKGTASLVGNTISGLRVEAYGAARVVDNTLLSASVLPAILNLLQGASATGNVLVGEHVYASDSGPIIDNVVTGCARWAIQHHGSSALIQANTIAGNHAGISSYASFSDISRNALLSNEIVAVWAKMGSGLFAGNLVAGNGVGVIINESGSVNVLNNTIVGNLGGLGLDQGLVANNIVYDNPQPMGVGWREVIIRNNVIDHADRITDSGGHMIWGPGNVDASPLFVDPGRWDGDTFIPGDYHLLPGSPCIDAGTNDVDNPDTPEIETLPDTDTAGLPRVIDGDLDGAATVDIGAYEYLPGDVNYDGKVNVLDLLLVRNGLGLDPASSIEARKADVNADGAVNVEDMIMVREHLGR